MKNISKFILTFFIAVPLVFAFGTQTVKRIDEIKNNTGTDIVLNPTDSVKINYFDGSKVLQSSPYGDLTESAVTNTELSFVSGVTSSIQTQINAKQDALTGVDGDLYYYNSGLSNLAIGTNGQILQVSALGFPEWVDLPPAVSVTTKGDLQTYSTSPDRLPVGTDGQVLQANSATSTGLEWIDADFYTSPLTTEGDLLYRDATQDTRLPIGTEDQVLTVNASGLPVWADSKGGGGSAGINFVFDHSFEKGELNPDTDASAVESYQLYTANDKLYAEFNEQYYRAAYTGLTANNTYVRDTFARTDLDGKQGLFSIWIKADAENFELCLRTDDSGFASACDDAYKLNILGDNTWRKYEIPFVYGASSVEYEIKNASYTGDVTIELDNIYIGTIPDGYIQQVGQAHFVGSAQLSTNCIYSRNSTSYGIMTDADICSFTSTKGNVSQLSNPLIGGINISNIRTDGYYRVFYQGLMYNAGNANVCYFSLSKSTSGDATFGETYVTSTNRSEHNTFADIRFNDGESGDIYILNKSNVATQCSVYGSGGNDGYWSVYFYPDSSSTIVTQDTELTAKTDNTFTAFIDGSGNVSQENHDWINGNCASSAGLKTCTFNTSLGLFNSMNCNVTAVGGDRIIERIISNTSTQIVYQTNIDGSSSFGYAVFLRCSKTGADVNKSATIVGKFENINSSDLVSIKYRRSTAQVIPNGTITPIQYDELIHDNSSGAWDSASGRFTAPKDGTYKVCASWLWDAASWGVSTAQWLYIGFEISQRNEVTTTNTDYYSMFGCNTIKMAKDDTFQIRIQQNSGANKQNISTAAYNYMTIDQQADYEAIVKNLSDQKTKCQTKYLSGDVNSIGTLADLTFNNIVVGKTYKAYFNGRCNFPSGLNACGIAIDNNGVNKCILNPIGSGLNDADFKVCDIKATSTTLFAKATFASTTAIVMGDGTDAETFLTLCELPDTHVETTEF